MLKQKDTVLKITFIDFFWSYEMKAWNEAWFIII